MYLFLLASMLVSATWADSQSYTNHRVQHLQNRHISRYHPQRHKPATPTIRYNRFVR